MELEKEVYIIFDRAKNEKVGSYSRAYRDEFEFYSLNDARNANIHGKFKDVDKYRVAKYRVKYELITDDAVSTPAESV